jgi:cell division protein FtsI (penicillin-binding protein 3)
MTDAPSPESPGHRFGVARESVAPHAETVRVTRSDLRSRAAMEKTTGRLVLASAGLGMMFLALAGRLIDATVIRPAAQHRLEIIRHPAPPPPPGATLVSDTSLDLGPQAKRAMITDRNGEILAISLPTAGLYANPNEILDPADAAHRLKQALPRLNEDVVRARLSRRVMADGKTLIRFAYLARQLTPREELAVNQLGIPGITFQNSERRRYPLGRVAAQILGGVDVDGHGLAGVEKFFEQRLNDPNDHDPLRLSIDVRVQAVVRDELSSAMTEFNAIAACGIVMDVRTGELLAVVNLPDYDANDYGKATNDARQDRAVYDRYEPGSTFKLQTAAAALDSGAAQLWNSFDAINPIKIGRFTITDFEGKHRMLSLPEVLVYSSNLGAAHIAMALGTERQRAWLNHMGMMGRLGIELPQGEVGMPIFPPEANWKEAATMTVGFGHGIAVTPLHVVRGTAAIANGGILLRPTILALPSDGQPPQGERVMQQSTSDTMRKLMRLVVTDGYGKPAEVAGYFVGGKTGTAEKVGHGAYKKHTNVSAFMSVFPMNAPRYAVYMMLDEPKANAASHGYATAGWVSAPAAGKVIGRIGPILGLLPQTDAAAAAIQASLAMPLEPGRGYGAQPHGSSPVAGGTKAPSSSGAKPLASDTARPPNVSPSAAPLAPARVPMARDLRHEAVFRAPADAVH